VKGERKKKSWPFVVGEMGHMKTGKERGHIPKWEAIGKRGGELARWGWGVK